MIDGTFELDASAFGHDGLQVVAGTRVAFTPNGEIEYLEKLPDKSWHSLGKGVYYQDRYRLSVHLDDQTALYAYEIDGSVLRMRPLLPGSVLRRVGR